MPKDLRDMPRPPSDNGRGLHGSLNADWNGDAHDYTFWVNELVELGIKWFKVIDDDGSSLPLCEKLIDAGIFPIVRILRRDPPPNDSPEPNPGHLGRSEEETVRRLIAIGVRYFETNNEPDRRVEWKHGAMPNNPHEAAKLVALNWLFDARLILEAGGYPGLPALSSGGNLDILGALVALGRQHILLEGCWLALHNYALNRPLVFPEDAVNRMGQPLTREQYEHGAFTEWVWWNPSRQRADTLDEINAMREARRAPTQTIHQDHACFREFEFYNALAIKYLGRSIPIISTEGGYQIGRRDDPRYPRITPALHCEYTVALYEWMQTQAPDYYFAAMSVALVGSMGREQDGWYSTYWREAFAQGTDGLDGFPPIAVPNANLTDRLPVVDAVKAMPNLARRLPGMQPAPPLASPVDVPATPPERRAARPGLANLFPDEPVVVAKPISVEPPSRASEPIVAPEAPMPPPSSVASEPPPLVEEMVEESTPVEEPSTPAEQVSAPSAPIERVELPYDVEWDFRLDALNVTVEFAETTRGQPYWRLISAIYEGPGESGDSHQIFYTLLNEERNPVAQQRVWQGWSDNQTDAVTNDHGQAAIPVWQSYNPNKGEIGPYTAWVDDLPSDRVVGIGLPLKHYVNFRLTWQRTIARR